MFMLAGRFAKISHSLTEVIEMMKNIIIAVLACVALVETMYIKEVEGYMNAARIFVESSHKEESK